MRKVSSLLVWFIVVLLFSSCGYCWVTENHQQQFDPLAKGLIIRDCATDDYRQAIQILELPGNDREIKHGLAAADNEPFRHLPNTPSSVHGWDPFRHCGFAGEYFPQGSYNVGKKIESKIFEHWGEGRYESAFFELGRLMHFVQDAAFSGHSHVMDPRNAEMHHGFETWVRDQTIGKSFEELRDGDRINPRTSSWAADYGGIYCYIHYFDEGGKEHWFEDLAGWIDVAAHLSYGQFDNSCLLDEESVDFHGATRRQFLLAQQVTAGLLVDFFKRVGVIEEPTLYFPREIEGRIEIWKIRAGESQAVRTNTPHPPPQPVDDWGEVFLRMMKEENGNRERALKRQNEEIPRHLALVKEQREHDGGGIWPPTSPNGKWWVGLRSEVETPGHAWASRGEVVIKESFLPHAGRIWFVDNQTIALARKDEGNNWTRIYLVPARWEPTVFFVWENSIHISYALPKEYRQHLIRRVSLP